MSLLTGKDVFHYNQKYKKVSMVEIFNIRCKTLNNIEYICDYCYLVETYGMEMECIVFEMARTMENDKNIKDQFRQVLLENPENIKYLQLLVETYYPQYIEDLEKLLILK